MKIDDRSAPRHARRVERRPVHGVLLLDKPLGLSSHQALQEAKRLYRAAKAGHTGTLDPLASGLLPVAFGAATKFSQSGLDADKRYRATLQLGLTTTTGDREGAVVARRPVELDRARIEAACRRFVGSVDQLPPMHSAVKKDGRALYAYARAGIEVARASRRVVVHRLEVVGWSGDELAIDIACSKGTYVRTLAADLGEALGCGAHVARLRRTGSGAFDVGAATTLEALAAMDDAQRDALLLDADALLARTPEVRLDAAEAARFLTGLRRRVDLADAPLVRVYGPERRAFLGSAHIANAQLIPDRLLSPAEVGLAIARPIS